jgi:hypothetical protein
MKNNDKSQSKVDKNSGKGTTLKPKQSSSKETPSERNPQAQYESKDES